MHFNWIAGLHFKFDVTPPYTKKAYSEIHEKARKKWELLTERREALPEGRWP